MSRPAEALAAAICRDPRWVALSSRDRKADGAFFYAVKTTGVYCRPSCGARTPKPENVAFFASSEDAQGAGFRPCRRCRPDQAPLAEQHARLVAALCRQIEAADEAPSLATLANSVAMSTYHLHRLFKAVTGLTPKAYATAHRAQLVRTELGRSATVSQAIYAAGYNSSGRFYEESNRQLGMTPRDYRAGGATVAIRFAVGQCSLGAILVATSARGVCAILLGDDPETLLRDLQDRFARAELIGGDAAFEQWVAEVVGFVEAPQRGLALPLDLRGTAFQHRVWQALQEIPAGSTATYTEIAQRIGAPRAVRAVAGACAANPLAVAIPCHRVVRHDGGLAGYRWGVERKRALLEREAEATKP
jgi:AraC family transcriptional regulator of adaptative response/methylated-DNA-[protein]-cysteine methyltransferase